MPIPSLPETLPRDLVPRKIQSFHPRGLASSLGLYRSQQFHRTRSSIGRAVANLKRLGTPTTFKQVFDKSPPSASSLLNRYARSRHVPRLHPLHLLLDPAASQAALKDQAKPALTALVP
ncbi:hypothetical protein M422DRAFT_261381 [Sphaerobolus stellatus SS14]|uniref:Uncharacterized protein n=1 Tax=Sphaerobolus stellatus (strain SS14) TaxID=990650 RepID=A0A0C9UN09_SPHS4|nr:hypothetical protein M422DRAFT_261381 [Sphaerobolus stellatus SS14]